jgi:hypothetical protein
MKFSVTFRKAETEEIVAASMREAVEIALENLLRRRLAGQRVEIASIVDARCNADHLASLPDCLTIEPIGDGGPKSPGPSGGTPGTPTVKAPSFHAHKRRAA